MAQETTMTLSTYSNEFNQFTPKEFKHPLFGNLNVLKDNNGNLWFIGVEVAKGLGYQNPRDAIAKLVPPQYKQLINISRFVCVTHTNPLGGNPNKTLISEQGLIELINKSDLNNPVVIQFKEFVNNSIVDMRKHGVSMSETLEEAIKNCNNIDELKKILLGLKEKSDIYCKALDEAQPAIHHFNDMINNNATITTSEIAQEYGLTAQELNQILLQLRFHHRIGDGYVINRRFRDDGLVKVRIGTIENSQYEFITKYTEKGRNLIDKLLHENGFTTKKERMDALNNRIQQANQEAYWQPRIIPQIVNNFFCGNDPNIIQAQINAINDPIQRWNTQNDFNHYISSQLPIQDTNGKKTVIWFTNPEYNKY